MPTAEAIKNYHLLAVRRALSQAPKPITELQKETRITREDLEVALATIEEATETKDGWVSSAVSTEQYFRNAYGFTPSKNQIKILKEDNNALVFSQLHPSRWQGISAIAHATDLSQSAIKKALKVLKDDDLAEGSENAWLRAGDVDEIEYVRVQLLNQLEQPMPVDKWISRVETEFSQTIISSAIALLNQEGLVAYDHNTGKYRRTEGFNDVPTDTEVQPDSDSSDSGSDDIIHVSLDPPPLNRVRIDGGTQPRTELNDTVISDYAEQFAMGAKFPPITVYFDGVSYWLADGFHRYHAAKKAEVEPAINVIGGTKRDAILHSVSANATHGLRRSNEDKRKAVQTLLEDGEWSQWSDRAIARQCQVSNRFVSNMRKELSVNGSQIEPESKPNRKVKRGNQVYEQNTASINRDRAPSQPKSEPQVSSDHSEGGSEHLTLDSSDHFSESPTTTEKEQPEPLKASTLPEGSKESIIPKIRSDIHQSICQFLGVEDFSYWSPEKQPERVYFIPSVSDLDNELTRIANRLAGNKITDAVLVLNNDDAPQQEFKEQANAVCLVSDSQRLCNKVIWYFGEHWSEFYSALQEYGITLVLKTKV